MTAPTPCRPSPCRPAPCRRSSLRVSLAFLALLAPASGCAIMGRQQKENDIQSEAVGQVRVGMTRGEVASLLGAPKDIIFSSKEHDPLREHAYVYEHVVTKYTGISFGLINFGNSDEKKDRVVVFFDEDGKVEGIGSSLHSHEAAYGFPIGD